MAQRIPPSIPPVATTSVSMSSPPTDAMVSKLGDGLQAQALTTLQGLQLCAEKRPTAEQGLWQKHTKALQSLIDLIGLSLSITEPRLDAVLSILTAEQFAQLRPLLYRQPAP